MSTIEIGRRKGKLTVVERIFIINKDKKKRSVFRCICDCGNETILSSHCLGPIQRGVTSCGCNIKEGALKRSKWSPKEYTARSIWKGSYNDGCSFEKFMELSQHNCHYCGNPPSNCLSKAAKNSPRYNLGFFSYNGLDRIDSSKDHSEYNIVPCCKTCNWMKNKMGRDEFLDHIKQIHKYLKL